MKKTLCVIFAATLLFLTSCSLFKSEKDVFIRGTLGNNVYTSELAQLKFAPGPGWSFDGEEELLEKNGVNLTSDMSPDAVNEILNGLDTVRDLEARDTIGGTSVSLVFEKLSGYVGADKLTEEEYIGKLREEIEASFDGIEHSISDAGIRKLAGKEHHVIEADVLLDGSEFVQDYYIRKSGSFIISVCISAEKTTDIEKDIVPLFTEYVK